MDDSESDLEPIDSEGELLEVLDLLMESWENRAEIDRRNGHPQAAKQVETCRNELENILQHADATVTEGADWPAGPFAMTTVLTKEKDNGVRARQRNDGFYGSENPIEAINDLLYDIRGGKSPWELSRISSIEPVHDDSPAAEATDEDSARETLRELHRGYTHLENAVEDAINDLRSQNRPGSAGRDVADRLQQALEHDPAAEDVEVDDAE